MPPVCGRDLPMASSRNVSLSTTAAIPSHWRKPSPPCPPHRPCLP
jgi:hypothetical protein